MMAKGPSFKHGEMFSREDSAIEPTSQSLNKKNTNHPLNYLGMTRKASNCSTATSTVTQLDIFGCFVSFDTFILKINPEFPEKPNSLPIAQWVSIARCILALPWRIFLWIINHFQEQIVCRWDILESRQCNSYGFTKFFAKYFFSKQDMLVNSFVCFKAS